MRAGEPQPSADRKASDRRRAQKTRRQGQSGPIGFGQVLAIAKRESAAKGTAQRGANQTPTDAQTPAGTIPSNPAPGGASTSNTGLVVSQNGFALSISPEGSDATNMSIASVDARVLNALSGISVSDGALRDLGEGAGSAADITDQVDRQAADGSMVVAQTDQQLLMTPERAVDTIADHAGDMDRMKDDSEFVLRLEPEHLGPLIIRISTRNGRIRAQLITANDQATAALASGQTSLRDKLAALGFAVADVEVRRRDTQDEVEIRGRFGLDA